MNATELRLEGKVSSDAFIDWIFHRAQLLSLKGWVTREKTHAITIVVTGPQPMIDAMEMACSLGPINVDVQHIQSCLRVIEQQPEDFSFKKF